MENKRKIPYGVINWAEIVRECLFVDNTAFIRILEEVLENDRRNLAWTRFMVAPEMV